MRSLSAALAVLALMIATGLTSSGSRFIDPDYWWHVESGRELLAGGPVVGPDTVSFATERTPYRRHSWGAELLMALSDRAFGLPGYRLLRGLIRAATAGLVALACIRAGGRSRPPLAGVLLAAAIIPFCTLCQELRPTAIAHVILAALLLIHLVAKRAPGKLGFAATLVLVLLLSPVHPTAVLALCFVGARFAGAFLERRRSPDSARAAREESTALSLLALASLALALDPQLFGALRSSIVLRSDAFAGGRNIAEWQPPQMWGFSGWLGIALGIAAAACLARSRRARPHEALILAGLLYVGLDLFRNTILLVMAALPLIARHGTSLCPAARSWSRRLARRPRADLLLSALALTAVLAAFLPAALAAHLPDDPVEAAEAAEYPGRAASWLLEHRGRDGVPARGRVINTYGWGGYLVYRLAPDFKVMNYGQNHLYSPGYWADFVEVRPEAIRKRLKAANADAALLPVNDRMFRHLLFNDEGWKVVYMDELAVILLPPARR